MRTELLTPAALLAQVALKNWHERYGELPEEAMTEAFLKAYRSLQAAHQQLSLPPVSTPD